MATSVNPDVKTQSAMAAASTETQLKEPTSSDEWCLEKQGISAHNQTLSEEKFSQSSSALKKEEINK